jgi:hypothetical protein
MTASTPRTLAFADHLRGEGIDVGQIIDRWVHIPWGGDPVFAFGIADIAVDNGYGDDAEVAKAVRDALDEVGFR